MFQNKTKIIENTHYILFFFMFVLGRWFFGFRYIGAEHVLVQCKGLDMLCDMPEECRDVLG